MSKRRRLTGNFTRRSFLKSSGAVGGGLWLTSKIGGGLIKRAQAEPVLGGTLDLTTISKYAMPLVIPPAMPKTGTRSGADYYEIAVRQFQQQILPTGMPKTTVWSYGSVNHPGTFNYPAFTIEADFSNPVRVKWINDLSTPTAITCRICCRSTRRCTGPTRPAALPAGTQPRYAKDAAIPGPVPIVTHVHGAHTTRRERRLCRGLVPARRRTTSRRLRDRGHLVQFLQGRSSSRSTASTGSPARRRSSIRTTSGRPHSGITTTPSA